LWALPTSKTIMNTYNGAMWETYKKITKALGSHTFIPKLDSLALVTLRHQNMYSKRRRTKDPSHDKSEMLLATS
jgi:hypothetical protein